MLKSARFDLRVFYVGVRNFQVDDSTREYLTLNHTPLDPDSFLEVNGSRSSIYSDEVSLLLRRDRVDKKSEEATFVCTDSARLTGSVKFDIFDKKDLILCGVFEISGSNGFTGESKNDVRRWSINCESEITSGCCFLKEKHISGLELSPPMIEVYVAGCFSGTPIILTKTLQLNHSKKHSRKGMLDGIPEYERTEFLKDKSPRLDMQVAEYRNYKQENDEDGELSWYNAGVRAGVGIGLGVCLAIGIGVGLLARTYQTATENFKKQLI